MKDISSVLCEIAGSLNTKFTLNDKPIKLPEIFSMKGLLPAIARRADQISTLCVGYGIGISFDESDSSVLGVRVVFDNVTPSSLRLMCITDVMIDIIDYSDDKKVVALDELLYD